MGLCFPSHLPFTLADLIFFLLVCVKEETLFCDLDRNNFEDSRDAEGKIRLQPWLVWSSGLQHDA